MASNCDAGADATTSRTQSNVDIRLQIVLFRSWPAQRLPTPLSLPTPWPSASLPVATRLIASTLSEYAQQKRSATAPAGSKLGCEPPQFTVNAIHRAERVIETISVLDAEKLSAPILGPIVFSVLTPRAKTFRRSGGPLTARSLFGRDAGSL